MSSSKGSDHAEDNLMGTITAIRKSENQADHLKSDAQVQADSLIKKARQEAAIQRTKSQEEAVTLKNTLISEGAAEIDSEVEQLLSEAKKEGASIAKKSLSHKKLSDLVSMTLFGRM